MADFLKHLLSRHRGEGIGIRPRLGSRYEPDPMSTAFPHHNAFGLEDDIHRSKGDSRRTAPDQNRTAQNHIDPPEQTFAQSEDRPKDETTVEARPATAFSLAPIKAVLSEKNEDTDQQTDTTTIPAIPRQQVKASPQSPPPTQRVETIERLVSTAAPSISAMPHQQAKPSLQAPLLTQKVETIEQLVRSTQDVPAWPPDQIKSRLKREARPASLVENNQQSLVKRPSIDLTKQQKSTKAPKQIDLLRTPYDREANHNNEPPAQTTFPAWVAQLQNQSENKLNGAAPTTETEPVINVTIGRVEVRAVQKETPQKPQKQKKPRGVMSLDEYLSGRK